MLYDTFLNQIQVISSNAAALLLSIKYSYTEYKFRLFASAVRWEAHNNR